jgi:hypothetical protein
MAKELKVAPGMAFHSLGDTPLHNAEGCIHIFFRESAGAPRPARITRKTMDGPALVCWKCGVNTRPMPEGATAETRYICPECSPLGVVCGGQLDRCQFDNWAIPERWKTGSDMQFSFRELVEYFIDHSGEIASVPSARIMFYRQNGLAWAKNATRERLAILREESPRAAAIFVAFYWAGLSCAEIATCLGITRETAKVSLTETKKKLATNITKA